MIAATLFSGIGAPEIAMPHWHWLWHAEIDPFPVAVMAARHPHSLNLGDVTSQTGEGWAALPRDWQCDGRARRPVDSGAH